MLSLRNLPRPVKLLGAVSFLNDVASELITPLLAVFISTVLGGGPAYVGLIEGMAEATASLTKLFSGFVSDKIHKRRALIVFGYSLSSLIRPCVGLTSAWWQVLLVRFGDRLGKGTRTAPRDALLRASAPKGQTGAIFGFHRAMDHAGAMVGPAIATIYLYLQPGGLRSLFLLAWIPGLISIFVVSKIPRDSPWASQLPTGPLGLWSSLKPQTKRFLSLVFLFYLSNGTEALLVLRMYEAGLSAACIPPLWVGLHFVKSGVSIVGGYLSDHLGRKPVLFLGWIWHAGIYLAFASFSNVWVLAGFFVIYGIHHGLTEASEKALIADLTAVEAGGTTYGWYHLTTGMAALPAAFTLGLIWQKTTAQAAFLTGMTLAMTASVLLLFLNAAKPVTSSSSR